MQRTDGISVHLCVYVHVCMSVDYIEHIEGLLFSLTSPTTSRQPRNWITPLGFENVSGTRWLKDKSDFKVKAGTLDIYI